MSGAGPRYRILRRLGQGGMAEVFEAELAGEHGFARRVALKRMLADVAADPAAARRFLDEARIASKLHHANIIAVVDIGTLDDVPFQVLEYVDGLNGEQLLARAGGTLPVEIALIIAADVAHALDHAHAAADAAGIPLGIVHRDVKPSNVLVAWTGDIKLSDFGIAVARDRAAQTETGAVVGTAGFLAPEQRTRSQLDGRTDVFALGLTLHALITGKSPLAEVSAELAVLGGEPVPLDPALPADVRDAIAAALAPARLARPTAGAFAAQLGQLLAPRLTRDPRSALRGFLGALAAPPARGGALDQLLGIEVVLDAAPGEVRRFHTVAVAPPAEPRRRAGLWAIAALAVLGLGGLAAWRLLDRTAAPAPRDAAAIVVVAPPDAAPDAPVDAAPLDAAPLDAGHRRVVRAPDAAVAEAGTGYFQITGDSLARAKVMIDGKPAGYVPNLIEIGLGHHRVEAIAPDGTRRAGEIDVTSFHTLKHPLRLAW